MNTKTIASKIANIYVNACTTFFSKKGENVMNTLLFVFGGLFIARLLFGFIFGK